MRELRSLSRHTSRAKYANRRPVAFSLCVVETSGERWRYVGRSGSEDFRGSSNATSARTSTRRGSSSEENFCPRTMKRGNAQHTVWSRPATSSARIGEGRQESSHAAMSSVLDAQRAIVGLLDPNGPTRQAGSTISHSNGGRYRIRTYDFHRVKLQAFGFSTT